MRDYYIIHKVQKGDTLAQISKMYKIPAGVITRDNKLSGDIYEGQRLIIGAVKGKVYTVQPQDTAESIAQKFGIEQGALLKANNTDIIYPYMNITIP